MKWYRSLAPRYVPAALAMLLPIILVYSSLRTFAELDQLRSVFLRNRSAAIAARLETLSGAGAEELDKLAESEPGVLSVRVLSRGGDPVLAGLWSGRELFRTENAAENGITIFRSYVPFHGDGQLRIAQIDLDASSADFLLVHARHNVVIATLSSGVIVLLAAYALWSMRRAAAEEKRRLEMTHLAHLGKMSAVLAHEIRTPLATIKGFTQLALESEEVRSMLVPVIDETQRLERLVSDLLLYGRPPVPAVRDCSWEEIAASLPGISSIVRVERASLRLRTDPELLRHVLGNLTRNAVEAAATTVRIGATVAADAIVITVEDNGQGIPGAIMDRVFESFYTTKSFGTGLGLPIAKSLTAALGGSLVLRPRDGGGTQAQLRLPAAGAPKLMEATA
jgi:two-component system sensor histidine kinase HydH